MIEATAPAFAADDVLVNNPVVRHFRAVENFALEQWHEVLAINLSAPFHTIRLARTHSPLL